MEEQGRPIPRHEVDGVHCERRPSDSVQIAGAELLHLERVLHRSALHRDGSGTDPARQVRRRLLWGRRERRLGVHQVRF